MFFYILPKKFKDLTNLIIVYDFFRVNLLIFSEKFDIIYIEKREKERKNRAGFER